MDKDTQASTSCKPCPGTADAERVDDDQGVIVAGAAARAAAQLGESNRGPAGAAEPGAPVDMAAADGLDSNREDAYWRENFAARAYVEPGASFDDYGPAYGLGVTAYGRYPGRRFEDVEPEMSGDWSVSRSGSSLSWERAKQAVRDAWNRISGSA